MDIWDRYKLIGQSCPFTTGVDPQEAFHISDVGFLFICSTEKHRCGPDDYINVCAWCRVLSICDKRDLFCQSFWQTMT